MQLDLNFVYYRNFRFDGKFHVRCHGEDLSKVSRIRYELERREGEGYVALMGRSAYSQAKSGKLEEHGCPVTFVTRETGGAYRIRPRVVLLDAVATAMGRPTGAAGVIDLPPLEMTIGEDELDRGILDKVPLEAPARRRKRELDDPYGHQLPPFPLQEEGHRYPLLLIKFGPQGYARLNAELLAESGSWLARHWPKLGEVIELKPYLHAHEHADERLAVLEGYYCLEQPRSMNNDTYVALLQTLAALDYVESLQFLAPEQDPGFILFGVSALLATLLTGAAVVAGNRANQAAQPTAGFEARQYYLDAPAGHRQGMNVRQAWARQVTGKGARIHFSDGGLYPNHEDLRGNPRLKVVTAEPNDDPKHGTASVGIMVAVRNGFGVTGISHDSELYLYNNRAGSASGAQTLKALLRQVSPGDIVGINRQTANIEVLSTFLPAVHDRDWWEVITQLNQRGAVVVVAAANGSSQSLPAKGTVVGYGVDLAQWRYFNDHGDAGAILIGACQSWDGKPHAYSNHGYRYRMLNAWGDSVTTLSYGALQDKPGEDRDYTDRYGGTSSATPLVAGALSLIQSYAMEQHHVYLDGNQMHLLVMASGYEDATLPDTQVLPMGARPNVQGALLMLDRILGGGRFLSARDEL